MVLRHSQLTHSLSATGDIVETGVTIMIPVYNEEGSVRDTIKRALQCLEQLSMPGEVIVINDGSSDGTPELLAAHDGIRLITHDQNRGYGASLKSGIRQARYGLVAIVDADGSYPIDELPELIRQCEHVDMVVGARTAPNAKHSKLRMLPKYFLRRFAEWLSRNHIPDLNSGMRVFRKSVAERFIRLYPDGFSFTTTITLAMLTNRYRVRFVPIDYYFRVGRSKIRPIADTLKFFQLILRTSMYFAPMRVFFPVAVAFFAAFLVTLGCDVFLYQNLNERTLILLIAATQVGLFSLLADMVEKRAVA